MWGSWGMPMWGFGWLVPLIGLVFCLAFVMVTIRAIGGGRFMCMGGHARGGDDLADLRREVGALREEVSRLKAAR